MIAEGKLKLVSVLIVEDEEDHARLIKKAITSSMNLENNLYWVENGQKAIDFLRNEGEFKGANHPIPELILLDIKLPLKNRFEVLKEIKNDSQLKKIPVVMLTTTSETSDIQKAMDIGANDYIVKPVKFSDFITKIGKLGYYWGYISDANGGKH